mmetsp:Transcript_25753/g.102796  ORF Transcript_25753/g.102796 Transcript_25753/m.102796 type:complete len:383 (+) Transcript_25753:450-1598(+)
MKGSCQRIAAAKASKCSRAVSGACPVLRARLNRSSSTPSIIEPKAEAASATSSSPNVAFACGASSSRPASGGPSPRAPPIPTPHARFFSMGPPTQRRPDVTGDQQGGYIVGEDAATSKGSSSSGMGGGAAAAAAKGSSSSSTLANGAAKPTKTSFSGLATLGEVGTAPGGTGPSADLLSTRKRMASHQSIHSVGSMDAGQMSEIGGHGPLAKQGHTMMLSAAAAAPPMRTMASKSSLASDDWDLNIADVDSLNLDEWRWADSGTNNTSGMFSREASREIASAFGRQDSLLLRHESRDYGSRAKLLEQHQQLHRAVVASDQGGFGGGGGPAGGAVGAPLAAAATNGGSSSTNGAPLLSAILDKSGPHFRSVGSASSEHLGAAH